MTSFYCASYWPNMLHTIAEKLGQVYCARTCSRYRAIKSICAIYCSSFLPVCHWLYKNTNKQTTDIVTRYIYSVKNDIIITFNYEIFKFYNLLGYKPSDLVPFTLHLVNTFFLHYFAPPDFTLIMGYFTKSENQIHTYIMK